MFIIRKADIILERTLCEKTIVLDVYSYCMDENGSVMSFNNKSIELELYR